MTTLPLSDPEMMTIAIIVNGAALHARLRGSVDRGRALLMRLVSALAEPWVQPRPQGPGGSCPHGWTSSGSFCVPSQGAQDAIAKPASGTCPSGWTASGSYLLAQRKHTPMIARHLRRAKANR
jgi:hypothetical protein